MIKNTCLFDFYLHFITRNFAILTLMVLQLDFYVTFFRHVIGLAHCGLIKRTIRLLPKGILPDSLRARSLGTWVFLIFPMIEFPLNYGLFIILLLLRIEILEGLFYGLLIIVVILIEVHCLFHIFWLMSDGFL